MGGNGLEAVGSQDRAVSTDQRQGAPEQGSVMHCRWGAGAGRGKEFRGGGVRRRCACMHGAGCREPAWGSSACAQASGVL